MKRLAALVCMAVLFFRPGVPAGETTVAFIPKLTGNSFFESANEGAQRYSERIGFKVEYMGSPVAQVAEQVAVVREAIEKKVDAICISSLDATGLDEVLLDARRAGIQVTTWDSDVSPGARTVMVSQGTPGILGEMLVEMGVKSLASRGKKPGGEPIRYLWHYSQAQVADQNSWRVAGEEYIRKAYPHWINVAPQNYFSEQDSQKALAVGEEIFENHPDVDLIICNDSTALPGQCQAAENFGKTSRDVTITGFSAPGAVRDYCHAGIIERWGLWDNQVQGALGCYLAYYLAGGKIIKVGDKIAVPEIGNIEVLPNTVLDPAAPASEDSGVVLLPERLEFTAENVDNYDF